MDSDCTTVSSTKRFRGKYFVIFGLTILFVTLLTTYLLQAGADRLGVPHNDVNQTDFMTYSDSKSLLDMQQQANSQEAYADGETVADLLIHAETLRLTNRLYEAETILSRAVRKDGKDFTAWRAFAAVQREAAKKFLDEGKLFLAAQAADRAADSGKELRELLANPSVPKFDSAVLTEEEQATNIVIAAIREVIDEQCAVSIEGAKNSANEAYKWYWKNDRSRVIEGLKKLKPVVTLGPWASETTRMNTNEAVSLLKERVSTDEWNDLLARAGFDPVSGSTLTN